MQVDNRVWFTALLLFATILMSSYGVAASSRRDQLIDRLQSDDVRSRRVAAQAIARLNDLNVELVDALRMALSDDDATVRSYASQTLGHFGTASQSAVPELIELLEDPAQDENGDLVWVRSSRALAAIGAPAVPRLIDLLSDCQSQSYYGSAAAIQQIGLPAADAVPHLIRQLEHAEGDNLWVTVVALAEFGSHSESAVPQLTELLEHRNFHIQVAACKALGSQGSAAQPAVPALLTLLDDGIASTRGHAALALGQIGPVEGHDVIGALLKHAEDFRDSVRIRSLMAIKSIGPQKAKSAVKKIKILMRHKDYRNRVQAADAYWALTNDAEEAIDVLVPLLDHLDTNFEALEVLKERGTGSVAVVPDLIPHLRSAEPEMRMETAKTLSVIGPGAQMALPELRRVAQEDEDVEVREAASAAIEAIME